LTLELSYHQVLLSDLDSWLDLATISGSALLPDLGWWTWPLAGDTLTCQCPWGPPAAPGSMLA